MRGLSTFLIFLILTGKLYSQEAVFLLNNYERVLPPDKKVQYEAEIKKLEERNSTDTLFDFMNWRYSRIGDYYDSLGQPDKAFDYYRLAVTSGEFDYGLRKRTSLFRKVAAKFLKEKQYDSILHYYSKVEDSKPRRIGCGMGRKPLLGNYYYYAMAALDGIGETDSAIKIFMPYAFMEWTNSEGTEFSTEHLFENDYHCQMLLFINILSKKYSFSKLNADVLALCSEQNIRTEKNEIGSSCYYYFQFSSRIGQYEYLQNGWSVGCKEYEKNKANQQDEFSSYFIRDIENSFIYRYFAEKLVL